MEAALPFTTLQRKQHLTLAVQIAKPLSILLVSEMRPNIIVYTFKPLQALRVPRELVTLKHRNERFDVNPPKLLVPFKLLARATQAIHKIKNAAMLLVPTIFSLVKRNSHSLFNQVLTSQSLAQIHHKPHRLNGMSRVQQPPVKTVHQFAIRAQMLHNQAQFRTVKHIHHLVNASVNRLLHKVSIQQRLNFKSHVTQNHGQRKTLKRTSPRRRLVPFTLRVVNLREHNVERALCNVGILLIARSNAKLPKSNHRKGVRKNVVRLNQGISLAVECKIPIQVAIMPMLL